MINIDNVSIPVAVVLDQTLPGPAKTLYGFLFVDRTLTLEGAARKLGITPKFARSYERQLIDRGFLEAERRRTKDGIVCTYHFPETASAPPGIAS